MSGKNKNPEQRLILTDKSSYKVNFISKLIQHKEL